MNNELHQPKHAIWWLMVLCLCNIAVCALFVTWFGWSMKKVSHGHSSLDDYAETKRLDWMEDLRLERATEHEELKNTFANHISRLSTRIDELEADVKTLYKKGGD